MCMPSELYKLYTVYVAMMIVVAGKAVSAFPFCDLFVRLCLFGLCVLSVCLYFSCFEATCAVA